jgi:hypothetical protein
VLGTTGEMAPKSEGGVGVMSSSIDAAMPVVGLGDSVGRGVGMITRLNKGVGLTPAVTVGTGVGVAVGPITAEPASGV